MGIVPGDAAMRCPSRMSETDVRRRKVDRRICDLTRLLLHVDTPVDADGDAPGIVTAIFQCLECIEHNVAELSNLADISKNAAHVLELPPTRGNPIRTSRRLRRAITNNATTN